MFRFLFILSFFLSCFVFTCSANSSQVDEINEFSLLQYTDHSKALTIDDISSLDLSNNKASSRFNIPVERANYWFIFEINNPTDQHIKKMVKFDEPFLYQADLYYEIDDQTSADKKWFHDKNGLVVPIEQRSIENRLPSFLVPLQAGETKTLYLMMNTEQNLLTVGIEVKSPHQYLVDEQFETAAYWLFFGISLAMLVYNVFLLVTLRDKLYLYYILYCASFLVFVMMYSGFDLYLVSSAALHYLLVVSISISVAFLAQFMRKLLHTQSNLPRIDLCLRFIIVLFLLQGMLTAINIHYYYFVVYIGMPSTLFLFFVSLYAYKKKIPLANYALFGLSWHILGLFAVAGVNGGFLTFNIFTRYGFMVGSLVELFVFSLALAYRVHHLQAQKVAIQADLYLAESKAKQLLEETVKTRTEELVVANKKLARLSQEDGLTGLYNRRFFDESIIKEWGRMRRQQHSLCLILADLDYFKQFNDIYGHQHGDQCLRLISQVIKKSINRSADLVARYGGEEFVIILPDSDAQDGLKMAKKIQQALCEEEGIEEFDAENSLTLSFGIAAVVPNDEHSIEELIKSADVALYQSKNNGRNQMTIFEPESE